VSDDIGGFQPLADAFMRDIHHSERDKMHLKKQQPRLQEQSSISNYCSDWRCNGLFVPLAQQTVQAITLEEVIADEPIGWKKKLNNQWLLHNSVI
jgi:hypothetical protein